MVGPQFFLEMESDLDFLPDPDNPVFSRPANQAGQKARPRIFPQSVQFLKKMQTLNRPVGMMLARLRAMAVLNFKAV